MDELLPVKIEPMSLRIEWDAGCGVAAGGGASTTPRPSIALWRALLIANIQLFRSSSDVA